MSFSSNILGGIKSFVIGNKLILSGAFAIITLFFVNRYNYHRYTEQKQESQRLQTNLTAATDTIRIIKTKDGSLSYQKLTAIEKSMADLKNDNIALFAETQGLKGQILNIQKAQLVLHTDTTKLVVKADLIDSTLRLVSKFDTTYSLGNYRHLLLNHTYDLKSGLSDGYIVNDQIGFTAVTGLLKTAKGYEIFVNPKYPGLQVQSLEGAIIDPKFFGTNSPKTKQPLITFGASIGYVPLVYEINNKKLNLNLTRVGGTIGLNFNLFR